MAPGARLQPSIYSYDGLRACALPMLARTAAHLPVYTGSDRRTPHHRVLSPPNDLKSAGTRRNRRFSRCGLFCHNCLTPYRISGPSNTKIEKSKISPPPPAESPPSSAPPHRPTRLAPRRPARQKTGGGRRRGFGSDWGRICRARATRSQDTTPGPRGQHYHLNQQEAARDGRRMVRRHQERARSRTN